jgi:xanthine/CO dehydrogenase XdhC/CoxF family maturation factor
MPTPAPDHAELHPAADPVAVARSLPPGSYHLVMTYSHPQDLAIIETVLRRGDFAWLGLIGSVSKRARFERQLSAVGLASDRLVCPIGIAGIKGKEPAVIAASVTAQLLIAFEAASARAALAA